MSREKKVWIKQFNERHLSGLSLLSKCQYATEAMLRKAGLSKMNIEDLRRDKYISKVNYQNSNTGKNEFVFKLEKRGKTACKQYLGINRFQGSSSKEHDIRGGMWYLSLSKEQQMTVKVEAQNRDLFRGMLKQIREREHDRFEELLDDLRTGRLSTPDYVYTNEEGVEIAVEIVGDYCTAQIEAKEKWALAMGMKFQKI